MSRRTSRLASEYTRAWLSLLISFPVVTALSVAYVNSAPQDASTLVSSAIGWDGFSVTYVLLTLRAFHGATAADLPHLLRRRTSRWRRWMFGGSEGPGFAVQMAVVALAGAALLPRLERFAPRESDRALLAALIVLAVVTAWVMVLLSFAVHYAREQTLHAGLAFPGTDPPGFGDYLYVAIAVSTTFGTTDVEVTTSRMRRVVNTHTLVAFVFNAVIVALLVAALVG